MGIFEIFTGESGLHIATLIDAVIPLIVFWLGFKFYARPPEMESKKGFTSIYTMANHEAWYYAQKLGGKLYMAIGAGYFLLFILKLWIFGEREPIALTVVYSISIFVMIFISHVIIQRKCREKYGHIIEEKKPVVCIWNLDLSPVAKTQEHDDEFMKAFENREEPEEDKKKRKKRDSDK